MKKFAMTYATVGSLINSAAVRAVSPAVKQAFDSMNSNVPEQGCSACAKKKKLRDSATNLLAQLQRASDDELQRIKRALGVDVLVFHDGDRPKER